MTPHDVDPRFTLANERTFLAWIRTSLGLLAASAGLTAVDLPWPAAGVRTLTLLLAAAAAGSAYLSWDRWRRVERALALGRAAPATRAPVTLALVVIAAAIAVVVLSLS